jgi:hypothetical protein
MKSNPTDPNDEPPFYVKSTHVKYILGEDASEAAKLRVIRALKEVRQIKIDRVPAIIEQTDVGAAKPVPFDQDCFAMPGVVLRRGEYYQVVLGDDQIFKAKANHMYFISFKVRARLDVLHDDPNKDGIHIQRPLGREKLVAEVHFPPTRKLEKILAVYEVRGSKLQEIDAKKFTINAMGPIQPVLGTITDMFRLTLPHPPQDADVRIMWQWSRYDENARPSRKIRPVYPAAS